MKKNEFYKLSTEKRFRKLIFAFCFLLNEMIALHLIQIVSELIFVKTI